MSESFSQRQGYHPNDAEIAIREGAPESLRFALPEIAKTIGMSWKAVRTVVCKTLFIAPNAQNWSDSNISAEVHQLLDSCDWFKVYDVAEALWQDMSNAPDQQEQFREKLNRLFHERGIGWELSDAGQIEYRGDEPFAVATREVVDVLSVSGHGTAAGEIHEALSDISRRPTPDRTGAIQHAIAAMECTAREVTGEPNLTLGKLVKRLGLLPPLDYALEKLWGFSSDRARHLREGQSVDADEAELVVSIACAVCTYLVKRSRQ